MTPNSSEFLAFFKADIRAFISCLKKGGCEGFARKCGKCTFWQYLAWGLSGICHMTVSQNPWYKTLQKVAFSKSSSEFRATYFFKTLDKGPHISIKKEGCTEFTRVFSHRRLPVGGVLRNDHIAASLNCFAVRVFYNSSRLVSARSDSKSVDRM